MSEFYDFPNEVIVKILTYLKVEEIARCHRVSKRINAICHDVTLWKKINIHNIDLVPAKLLQLVLNNGCKYLSLNWSTVEGNLVMNKASKLRYFDMTNFTATDKFKEQFLASCHSLEKVSLLNTPLNKKMVRLSELLLNPQTYAVGFCFKLGKKIKFKINWIFCPLRN